VARGSRDDSSPQEPWHLRNMISKSPLLCVRPAGWKLLATLALVLAVMVWYSISREDRYTELFYFPIPGKKEPCLQEDLLLRVLAITSYSVPESIQSLKCRRCVVVGNGHRLRNSSLGEAINKYDVVIRSVGPPFPLLFGGRRLNSAPVAGYEHDVRKGFWKQPPLIWDVNPKQIRILNPFFMEIAADKLLSLPIQQPYKIKQVMMGCRQMGSQRKPTTGLLAITLALHLCDLVHIAGFGYPDAHHKKQSIHYYEYITLKSMVSRHGERSSRGVGLRGGPGSCLRVPQLASLAWSGHNVSQEALAIKRMLEIGAVKNLTYF
ncbi:hypothetical protein E2I00_011621, partial [Balaenoptera physalus]